MFPNLHPTRRLLLAIPVAGTIIAIALTAAWLLHSDSGDADEHVPLSLAGIDMQGLIDDGGLVFTAPGDEKAAITPERAEEILDEGYDVRETVLAHLKDEGGSIDSLVWIVNYGPLSVPPMTAGADYLLYYIGVVDAKSGEFLFYQGSADSCPRADLFRDYEDVTAPVCSGDAHP